MPDATLDNDNIENTILAIQMDRGLRNRIKIAAMAEHRTESSFARYYLERAADAANAANVVEVEP
jgi:hypothetical protein